MTATAGSIVQAAFLKSGILGDGEAMGAGDLDNGLSDLQDLLAMWNEQRWLVWHLLDFGVTSTGQTTPYSVGPGQTFNMTPRPSRIQSAYVVQTSTAGGFPVSVPLKVIESYEEYSRVALKTLISFPKYVFLDTASPYGNLYLYPWPNASIYAIHIVVKDVWPVTVAQNTSFANYPPFTIPGIKFNLARWLRQGYGKGLRPDPELNALAKSALDVIKGAQVQVPELLMPRMLIGTPKLYNVFSDQSY